MYFDPLYIFDLDGTLADCRHRLHFLDKNRHDADGNRIGKNYREFYAAVGGDAPIQSVIETFQQLRYHNDVAIWTGRSNEVRSETVAWLRKHAGWSSILMDGLKMRPRDDHRPDTVLKAEWYHALPQEDKDRLVAVFEDRSRVVKMWRDLGVTCFQVAEGEF